LGDNRLAVAGFTLLLGTLLLHNLLEENTNNGGDEFKQLVSWGGQ
jgi:hypothetical protein